MSEQLKCYSKWLVFLVSTISTSLVFVEMTILPVALPSIRRDFFSSETELQWMINAYSLAFAVFIMLGGRLGDLFGKRRLFMMGIALFGLSSIGCALSMNSLTLIIFRFFLGVGTALMYPNIFSILIHAFPSKQRGAVGGLNTAVGSILLTAGPFLGGMFTEQLSWRYIFWINLPLVVLAFFAALLFIPRVLGTRTSIDWKGFFLFTLGFSLVVIGIMQGTEWRWDSYLTIGFLVLGILLLVCFYFFEKKQKHPFMDVSLFKSRLFVNASFGILIAALLFLSVVYWPIYFQEVLGYSPQRAGEVFMIANAPVLLGAPIGGLLFDRYSLKVPIYLGTTITFFAFIWMSSLGESISFYWMIPGLLALGLGNPMSGAPSLAGGVASVPAEKSGTAAGILGALRGVGGALGIALAGAVFSQTQYDRFAMRLLQDPETANLDPSAYHGLLSKIAPAVRAVKSLSSDVQDKVYQYIRLSAIDAFSWTYYTMAGFCILIILITIFLSKSKKKTHILDKL